MIARSQFSLLFSQSIPSYLAEALCLNPIFTAAPILWTGQIITSAILVRWYGLRSAVKEARRTSYRNIRQGRISVWSYQFPSASGLAVDRY